MKRKTRLWSMGKGFVIAQSNDGFPPMRRLVEAYTCGENKKYFKLDGKISRLLPRHMFLSAS